MNEEMFLKRKHKKFIATVSLFLCFAIINSVSAIAFSGYRSIAPNAISTTSVHGIVAGETLQLYSSSNDDGVYDKDGIWSSSNPDVILCTPGGSITGLKANNYADITCTSKSDGSTKTFKVYCVRAVYPQVECTTNDFTSYIYAQPNNNKLISVHMNFNIMWNFLTVLFKTLAMLDIPLFPSTNSLSVITSGSFTVYGQYGNFAYIRFNEDPTSDGFVKYTDLSKKINSFLYLSDSQITIKTGTNEYLKCDYSGTVNWTVENDADDGKKDYKNSIIKFDPSTGKITPQKGGITSITASANGMSQTCKIYSIYMWPQEWKVTAEKSITFYELSGAVDYDFDISKGDTFYVIGDLGGSDGRCYVRYGTAPFDYYAYAKIEDFSTKGTISQYNSLTTTLDDKKVPLAWPVYDKSIKYISSPYGPRNITSSGSIHHRGFDITTGVKGEIKGEYVVAACSGIVTKIHNNTTDCGYCISISTDCIDPITNNNISIIYMHLLESPKYEKGNSISIGDYIKVGTIIGKVGNTNGYTDPDMGYHLHFEANSQNAAVGDYGRDDFTYTINPMYFFLEKDVSFSKTNSYNKYGGYWYDIEGGYVDEKTFKSYFIF